MEYKNMVITETIANSKELKKLMKHFQTDDLDILIFIVPILEKQVWLI